MFFWDFARARWSASLEARCAFVTGTDAHAKGIHRMRLSLAVSALALCLPLMACGDSADTEAPATGAISEDTAGEATQTPAEDSEAEGDAQQAPSSAAELSADDASGEAAPMSTEAQTGSLAWAVAGEWRADAVTRDVWRHPAETLEFFGVDPSGTIIEIWPAGGWYTQVLAPWIAANDGTYVAAHFPADGNAQTQAFIDGYVERFSAPLFGEIEIAAFGPETGPIVPDGSADAVLTFRNVHNWMARGFAEKAFADFLRCLAARWHTGRC